MPKAIKHAAHTNKSTPVATWEKLEELVAVVVVVDLSKSGCRKECFLIVFFSWNGEK
jgi:hypothetical protein